jgi:hypothetical protein
MSETCLPGLCSAVNAGVQKQSRGRVPSTLYVLRARVPTEYVHRRSGRPDGDRRDHVWRCEAQGHGGARRKEALRAGERSRPEGTPVPPAAGALSARGAPGALCATCEACSARRYAAAWRARTAGRLRAAVAVAVRASSAGFDFVGGAARSPTELASGTRGGASAAIGRTCPMQR